MYYLNDKHSKYEYAVYCKVGNALPYIQTTRNSLEDIYRYIGDIERKHNHYGQRFYIDNDFYDNKFDISSGGTYYKILRRPVADWEEFSNEETYLNNIIYLYKRN